MESAAEGKLCRTCLDWLPLDHFRRRRRGSEQRETDCRACHRQQMQTLRARRRAKRLREFLAQVHRARGRDRLVALVRVMLRLFGGLAGFAAAFCDQMESAPPGSRARIVGFAAVLRLMEGGQG